MQWDHIDTARAEMFVAQIKTGVRIWVPFAESVLDCQRGAGVGSMMQMP
jgi:hypothetical protein